MTEDISLRRLAARLGREVVIEEFGVYLLSRSGADDEFLGRTEEDARRALVRRVQRKRAATAKRSDRPN